MHALSWCRWCLRGAAHYMNCMVLMDEPSSSMRSTRHIESHWLSSRVHCCDLVDMVMPIQIVWIDETPLSLRYGEVNVNATFTAHLRHIPNSLDKVYSVMQMVQPAEVDTNTLGSQATAAAASCKTKTRTDTFLLIAFFACAMSNFPLKFRSGKVGCRIGKLLHTFGSCLIYNTTLLHLITISTLCSIPCKVTALGMLR